MSINTNQNNLINHIPNEVSPDQIYEQLNSSDLVNLFQSIAPEFGNGEVSFSFDESTASVLFMVNGIGSSISVADIDPFSTWTANSSSEFVALRALIEVEESLINTLNTKHPNTKFYSSANVIIAEEAFYLGHGVASLNLLDRFSAFLNTIRSFSL